MEPTITITVSATTPEDLANRLMSLGEKLLVVVQEGSSEVKTTKKTKAIAEEDDTEDFDIDGEEEEKTEAIELPEVINAFKEYAGSHSRMKAQEVLKKFKVKSVRDLKEKDYEKVMKLLAA